MKYRVTFIVLGLMGAFSEVVQAGNVGLIGGREVDTNSPYAAFVGSDGSLTQLSGPGMITEGSIGSVSINSRGAGLIGGRSFAGNGPGFAAYVSPDGTVTQLSGAGFPISAGNINSVAINESGAGLIGGQGLIFSSGSGYAAYLHTDGTLQELSGGGFPSTSGNIYSVAINQKGVGLIGGLNETGSIPAYAAFVSPSGSLQPFSGADFPSTFSEILSVAINDLGFGLIGGGANLNAVPTGYAALVNPNGAVQQLSGSGFPLSAGIIESVAINNSGIGLIGGGDLSGTAPAYAAFMAPNGTLTQLSGDGFPTEQGIIYSVSINEAGAGIIGGQGLYDTIGTAYAALVAPDGTLTSLSGGNFPSAEGIISSVVINDAGIAMIAGQDYTGTQPAYAALVAPNGILTPLTGPNFPTLNGSFASVSVPDLVTPKSFGSYMGPINTQLAAIYALESHFTFKQRAAISNEETNSDLSFVASLGNNIPHNGSAPSSCKNMSANTIWMAPFGNIVHQKAEAKNPSYTDEIAGVLIGYDRTISQFLVGGGAGYAFNYIHYGSNLGHATVQEEMVCVYGGYQQKYLRINFVAWGGYYEFYNKRHSLPSITSTSNSHGWIFSPHLEVATPFSISENSSCFLEPFAMFDWVNSWQHGFTEKGSSGLNLEMDDHYGSLLRSEVGLRFYEEWCLKSGELIFEQKLSYVNQAPFHFNDLNASFVASASTFPIAIGSTSVQNLGGLEVGASYTPKNKKYPYFSLSFQGEFGSSYQSYFLGLEVGKLF